MAQYSKEHKEATRHRITERAGRALADRKHTGQVLEQGIDNALLALDTPASSPPASSY